MPSNQSHRTSRSFARCWIGERIRRPGMRRGTPCSTRHAGRISPRHSSCSWPTGADVIAKDKIGSTPRGGRVSRTRDRGPAAGKRRRHQRNQPRNENTAAQGCDKPVAPGGRGDVGGRRSRRSSGGRLRRHAPAPGRRPEVVSTGLKGPQTSSVCCSTGVGTRPSPTQRVGLHAT